MKPIKIRSLNYPAKILLAWKEAIGGNKEIRSFLLKSKYKELGVFCFALINDKSSREWLLKNNYAHLLALIHGVEGKTDAWYWLKKNEFTKLFHMARGGDSWKESLDWLKERDKILYGITLQMEKIKDEIDEKNNAPHKINP